MRSKNGLSHLNASIKYSFAFKSYRIEIDGDVFWADTYEHAVCKLVRILMRDEIVIKEVRK